MNIQRHEKGIEVCTTVDELALALPKMMRILGVHLGLNTMAFQHVLQVVNHYMI